MGNKINVLLIGFGPHAQRIYFPIYLKEGENKNFEYVYGIDLEEKKIKYRRVFEN